MALPSMFGGGVDPAASFGWQLDDLEIWGLTYRMFENLCELLEAARKE